MLAAVVAAVMVPVGFALSLDSRSRAMSSSSHAFAPMADAASPSPFVATTTAAFTALPEIPDGAKLFAVGAALFGIAAAMRRSS